MRRTTAVATLSICLTTLGFPIYAAPRVVALSIDRHGGLIVETKVNGSGPYRFLIDTGSSRTTITRSLSERLRAPAVARTEVVSAGSTEQALVVELESLSVGPAVAESLLAIVVADRRFRDLAGNVDGIVGQDFLSRYAYLIDRDRRTLTWNPGAAERPAGGTTMRLQSAEGRFLLELPQPTGELLLMVPDSGAETMVLFENGNTSRLAMRGLVGAVELNGLSGSRRARRVALAALQLGETTTLRQQPAVVVTAATDTGSDGLLPMKLFRKVMVDSHSREMKVWP
jgi:predicted aspartyl protease